jgi:mRNA interferase HigB
MVQIISEKYIKEFMDKHPEYAESLKAWMSIVKHSTWEKPQDIVETFGAKAVEILQKGNRRVIIDVKGNNIRIIAQYKFYINLRNQKKTRFYIKWRGTHAEYDKLCKKNLQYTIDNH